jgi:hypothetical protein
MVMSEQLKVTSNDSVNHSLEERTRVLFKDSVDGLDFSLRSRLTQARVAALEAAARPGPWLFRPTTWAPAAGVTAAAVLGVALWIGSPAGSTLSHQGTVLADSQNIEDLDLLAASDENSGDAIEMLQDDIDFYDFADKAAGLEPAA